MAAGERPDASRGEHLPNLREGRRAPHPGWLPRQRRGITPQMIGRYPDYDVLQAAHTWDPATRAVVLARLRAPGPMRFFCADQQPTLRALCDVATAQDAEPRIPVAEMVDQQLADGRLDGFRHADMPSDPDTWQIVLAGLDETAQQRHGQPFGELARAQQEAIVAQLAAGELSGGAWEKLNVQRAWSVCMRAILAAFYSHPWAWNEIGFGGPAYPRGFMRSGPISVLEDHERPGAVAVDPVARRRPSYTQRRVGA